MIKLNLILFFMFFSVNISFAQHKSLPLWEKDIPGALKKYYNDTSSPATRMWLALGGGIDRLKKDSPSIIPYLAPPGINKGSAVLICPGGAYAFLDFETEGVEAAKWLNDLGISAFVLDSRHAGKGYHQPYPLLDAQRAMRILRANAEKWKIEINKIGVMGFSAGGHLASSLGTHFDYGVFGSSDKIDRQSCRPDFMILIYPIITMGTFTHKWSKGNLIGEMPADSLIKYYSGELQVTNTTPPSFLVHAIDDRDVPYENSLEFFNALQKEKIPAEIHLYQKGGHGFGMGIGNDNIDTYTSLLRGWLVRNKIL